MKNVYDVQMLLKRFGTFIYTRDRIGDLILMENELNELYKWNFITQQEFTAGKLILQKERRLLQNEKRNS